MEDPELEIVEMVDAELADDSEEEVVLSLVASRPSAAPPPLPVFRVDGLAQLEKERSPWRAAGIAAAALAKALGARTVLVHSINEQRNELRTVGVDGPRAPALLGCSAELADDFIASALVTNGRPIKMSLEDGLPRFAPERLSIAGAKCSINVVPIMCGPHCVGMIELVDVREQHAHRVGEACAMVNEHLALLF